jgi:hypothetical protein
VKTLHKRLVGAPILGAELVCVLSARGGPAFEHREGVPLCASDGVRQLVPLAIRPAFFQPRFATRRVASGREPLFVHAAPFKARTPERETEASVHQSKATNVPNGANGCASSSEPAAAAPQRLTPTRHRARLRPCDIPRSIHHSRRAITNSTPPSWRVIAPSS